MAWTLWYLGYPEQALKKKSEALTLAHELSHPPSLIWALNLAAKVHLWRREAPAVFQQVEPMLQLANEHGIPYWLAEGTMLRGWVLTEQGEVQEGITQMRQGLVAWRAMGARVAASYFLSLPIVAYGKGGQVEEGLSILTEALDIVHNTGERVYEAELYRLKGELLLNDEHRTMNDEWRTPEAKASLHAAEAEVCFQRAIEVARSQQAKSWELRSATSLARLWQQQGKKPEAYQLLSEVYNWFTEGFDTADLKEAKALLAELNE